MICTPAERLRSHGPGTVKRAATPVTSHADLSYSVTNSRCGGAVRASP